MICAGEAGRGEGRPVGQKLALLSTPLTAESIGGESPPNAEQGR